MEDYKNISRKKGETMPQSLISKLNLNVPANAIWISPFPNRVERRAEKKMMDKIQRLMNK